MRRAAVFSVLLVLGFPAAAGSAEQASGPRAKRFVYRVAAMGPRVAGSATERRAARMVQAELRTLGYRVRIQRFRLPEGGVSQNVVGLSRGPTRAIVVAHLDGVAAGPAANDNGSGVAAMLEVARTLRGRPGLLVAALGAEERQETGSSLHLGSARLLRGISAAGRQRIGVAVSLDMVGVGPTLNIRGLEPAPNRSAVAVLRAGRSLAYRVSYLQDNGLSDHAEMTRGGLPAAWMTWRWDTCWHRACDTADRVSGAKMVAAARLTIAAVRPALAP